MQIIDCYYLCPICRTVHKDDITVSCFIFNARYWTDSYWTSSMSDSGNRQLVKCSACEALLWLEDLASYWDRDWTGSLRDEERKREGNSWLSGAPPWFEPTSESDYRALLAQGVHHREREILLRQWIWWEANDERRYSPAARLEGGDNPDGLDTPGMPADGSSEGVGPAQAAAPEPLSIKERQNLEALALLLDETNERERLTKAEVMRELGRFEEASALLAAEFPSEWQAAVATIRDLADRKISHVAEIIYE